MGWDEIIEGNRQRILAAIAPLLAVLGFDPKRRGEMPRHFYNVFIILLRPAESAVRRLIIMAARGIIVKLAASRAFPAALKLRLAEKDADEERIPAFCLIDPLKRFAPDGFEWSKEWGKDRSKEQALPRISVPGLIDPVFAEPAPIASRDDPIDTEALVRRIRALKAALDNLPRHARQLARWKARRGMKTISRMSPFRPGFAPGFYRTNTREIDAILSDCHYFARQAWDKPDTS
jgi:hypothetical protein